MRKKLSFLNDTRISAGLRAGQPAFKVKPLADCGPDERLVAALLRGDAQAACHLLTAADAEELARGLSRNQGWRAVGTMLYDQMVRLALTGQAERIVLDGRDRLLDVLKKDSIKAISTFTRKDELWLQLIDILAPLPRQPVWIKGPALAHTLYAEAHFRRSMDFDIVVAPDFAAQTLNLLEDAGFLPVWNDPGLCHQFGIGPVGSLDALAIRPSAELDPFHNLTLRRDGWPLIEMKCNHLETGIRPREGERFFSQALDCSYGGRHYLVPALEDHLLAECCHLHKHSFSGWRWLYDIHLICQAIAGQGKGYSEFIRIVKTESANESAWASLILARDRLGSPVPDEVIEAIRPERSAWLVHRWVYSAPTEFLWNSASLPALLKSAICLGDRRRRLAILRQCLFPNTTFLLGYYGQAGRSPGYTLPLLWLFHLAVLFFRGSIIRHTLGRLLWSGRLRCPET